MFGQLSNRESLRDIVLVTQAHASKVNINRDYLIFEEFAYKTATIARECRATEMFKLGGKVYAIWQYIL